MIHNFGWFSKIIDKRFQNVIWVVECSLEMSKYRLKISKTMTLLISIHRITIFYLMMIAMTRKMRSLFLVFFVYSWISWVSQKMSLYWATFDTCHVLNAQIRTQTFLYTRTHLTSLMYTNVILWEPLVRFFWCVP